MAGIKMELAAQPLIDQIQAAGLPSLPGRPDRVDYLDPAIWGRNQREIARNLQFVEEANRAAREMQRIRALPWEEREALLREQRNAALTVKLESTTELVELAEQPSAEYRERLKRLGATALLEKLEADEEAQRFRQLVVEHGLRFYTRSNVEQYLLAEAEKARPSRGWDGYAVEWVPLAKYKQAIPLPVLETMDIVKQQHATAEFFISEVKRYPDPFLMVRLRGSEFIIERWDEPGYRE